MISKELKTRLDTFIDAILAIIITIMVLELPAQSWEHHANITNFFLAVGGVCCQFLFRGEYLVPASNFVQHR